MAYEINGARGSVNTASRNSAIDAMNARSEIYRGRAEECEYLAAKTHNPEVKRQFITIARLWREMAEKHERNPPLIEDDWSKPE